MRRADTGALRASAISWAFWLTLALLPRTVRIASLKLFCLPCLPTAPPLFGVHPFMPCEPLRACQRSWLCRWGGSPSGCGMGDAGFGSMGSCVVCSVSSDRSGNLKVAGDGDVEARRSICDVDMAVEALRMRVSSGKVDYNQLIHREEVQLNKVLSQPFDTSFIKATITSLGWTHWQAV